MKFGRLGELKHGYNAMTTRDSDMMMDIGYQVMDAGEELSFQDPEQETAFVILSGQAEIRWNALPRDRRERLSQEVDALPQRGDDDQDSGDSWAAGRPGSTSRLPAASWPKPGILKPFCPICRICRPCGNSAIWRWRGREWR